MKTSFQYVSNVSASLYDFEKIKHLNNSTWTVPFEGRFAGFFEPNRAHGMTSNLI